MWTAVQKHGGTQAAVFEELNGDDPDCLANYVDHEVANTDYFIPKLIAERPFDLNVAQSAVPDGPADVAQRSDRPGDEGWITPDQYLALSRARPSHRSARPTHRKSATSSTLHSSTPNSRRGK
jgi:hypothetical protein